MGKLLVASVGALIISLSEAPCAEAQVQVPGSIFEFGDSFQDAGGYICAGFGSPLKACSNYKNTPMQLGSVSAYKFVLGNDFAIGGTASGPGAIGNPGLAPYPGYPTTYPNMFGQIAEFASLGGRIGPNDLVSLSFAGNDLLYGGAGPGLAHTVVGYLTTDVQSLINLGARNFILYGGLSFDRVFIGGSSLASSFGVSAAADRQYYTTLNAALPNAIAPFESTSVHIHILDVNTILNRVLDNPASYGFIAGDCATTPGCPTAPLAVQNQYAFCHSVHSVFK
jgi:phospholipase/lecithinase/hemolysin